MFCPSRYFTNFEVDKTIRLPSSSVLAADTLQELLLLLLLSSFSTIRAGLRCRASCWVENRFPEYNAWFFGDCCAMKPVHLQLLVPLYTSDLWPWLLTFWSCDPPCVTTNQWLVVTHGLSHSHSQLLHEVKIPCLSVGYPMAITTGLSAYQSWCYFRRTLTYLIRAQERNRQTDRQNPEKSDNSGKS